MTTQELDVVQGEIVDLPAPLSATQAKKLDKEIRATRDQIADNYTHLLGLINKADKGQIWVALGLPSMAAYLKENVQIDWKDIPERRALSEAMAGKGFSNRTAAAILNVDEKTIRRDTNGVEPPSVKHGADGKDYPTAPKDKGEEQAPLDVDEVPESEQLDETWDGLAEYEPDTDHGTGVGGGDYVEPEPDASTFIDTTTLNQSQQEEPAAKPQPVSKDFKDEMGYLANSVASFNDILDDPRFAKAAKTIAKNHLNDLTDAIAQLQKVVDCLMEVT